MTKPASRLNKSIVMSEPRPSAQCPFCILPKERIWLETDAAVAVLDGFPISDGHSLVIPKRHVELLFDLSKHELMEVWSLVGKARRLLREKYKPNGFNIGVNEGQAAGQTIGHAHVHIIPRRLGDVPDPKGGIRWVIPAKAKYW
jgi:diadenosine tetraphosphate (Ap4A) HIT family hydrolase